MFALILWAVTASVAAAPTPTKEEFGVTVTYVIKGTYKKMTHSLTGNRIQVIEHSTNDQPDKTVFERDLTQQEALDFSDFFKKFPIKTLRSRYANDEVEGEGRLVFDIQCGETRKSVTVYFFKQPDLWELAKKINTLVPDHPVFYGREGVDD